MQLIKQKVGLVREGGGGSRNAVKKNNLLYILHVHDKLFFVRSCKERLQAEGQAEIKCSR